jgi:peptidoglycan biosynthesis protein MviN/MurJ (putative lipid II flippase)
LWYCFAGGLAVLIYRRPSTALIGGLFFSAFIIAIFSYTSPNVGTLYRVRFGCWMFFLLAGSVGWASLLLPLLNRLSAAADKTPMSAVTETEQSKANGGISGLAAAGSVAMAITFVCFLGFLARDLLLINLRGMGGALDTFFAAAMLPMVFVTCLVMPMTDAVTKPFLVGYRSRSPLMAQNIIARFMGIGVLVAVVAMAATFIAAPQAIKMLTGSESDEIISQGALYLRLFAPIILLSVWTVLGNSVLNSLHKSTQAAGAQLIVPVFAISAIIFAGSEHALLAGICGMLVGTALNAAVVLLLCRWQGVRLLPSWVRGPYTGDSLRTYLWLAFAAVFTALLVPLNYHFASTVGEGFVSAWAFASKIIILFNSIFAFGVTAVVLPHLARKFDRQRNEAGRNHLYFLLVAGTWAGGFIALALAIFAEPLVFALLSTGDKITEEQIVTLARVLRLGALQVPVAITAAIALKSVAVSGAAVRAVLASFCGLVVNYTLNCWLVIIYGIEGIALGLLGALMVSTVLLCAGLRSGYGMSLLLGVVLPFGWLVWGCAAWAIEIHSSVGMGVAAVGLVLLMFLQWIFWSKKLHHRRSLRYRDVPSQ